MTLKSVVFAVAATMALPAFCAAQPVAEFYKGKSLELFIGTSVGGGYDAYARMLARHMTKYIPGNPLVVPKNMTGGGGMRLANYLYSAAAKDGLVFGTINRGIAFDPLLNAKSNSLDAGRFNWVGSANNEVSVCVAWHTSGVTNFKQVLSRELVVGASGQGGDTFQFPKIINGVLGSRFKIITGYPGGNDVDLAMERQEVQGRCGWSWTSVKATHPTWLSEKKINILFQMGLTSAPDLPDVPLIMDLARNDEERAIFKLMFGRQVMAWPYVLPPNVPADRITALRQAFNATMRDKDFLADAAKGNFEINPVTGEAIQALLKEIYATPAPVVRKAVELLQ